MSIASTLSSQQSAVAGATSSGSATPASSAGSTSASTSASTGSSALTSLSSNFNTFLQMLMTQLKNQDPTSPMDSNQFTSELVQFSSVEQQINTNTSLTSLIQLTQAGQIMNSSSMVGKQVEVTSTDLALQNGQATIHFNSPAAEPVGISVTTDAGVKLLDTTTQANSGSNSWTWNGKTTGGNQLPDGAYKVTVTGQNTDGTTSALDYTVLGTATGVKSDTTNGLNLQLGPLAVPFKSVVSVN